MGDTFAIRSSNISKGDGLNELSDEVKSFKFRVFESLVDKGLHKVDVFVAEQRQ